MNRKFMFFKRDEIQKAKKEKRNPVYSFSIETDSLTLSKLINKYELDFEYTHN